MKNVYITREIEEKKRLSAKEKLSYIKAIVEAWYNSKTIKDFVEGYISYYDLPREDKLYLSLWFAKWIKKNIKFVPQPSHFADRLRTPYMTLKLGFGDCTEHSILLASILKYLGIDFNYVLCATNPKEPYTINHIYIEAVINGKKIPLDTTERYKKLGQEPINFYKERYR